MSHSKPCVLVVPVIDTEGPINDPNNPDILSSWFEVFELADKLFEESFRNSFADSSNHGPIFSWFILTLTGFKTNPFGRAMGPHAIYDPYVKRYGSAIETWGDEIQWHYHHPAPSGIGNEWCTDWLHCQEYDSILSRLITERDYFPSCFRAGGRIQNNDQSVWLEEILPFDFSNCAGPVDWDAQESDGNRLGDICDWRRAPDDFSWYNPGAGDYQTRGNQARTMFRCPDLNSSVHKLDDDQIKSAFDRTMNANETTVLSFFEHDRRMRTFESLIDVFSRISEIASLFPSVPWYYAGARSAAVGAIEIDESPAPVFTAAAQTGGQILISTRDKIFGDQPFVALAEPSEAVRRIRVKSVGAGKWLTDCAPKKETMLAIAANSPSGNAGILKMMLADLKSDPV